MVITLFAILIFSITCLYLNIYVVSVYKSIFNPFSILICLSFLAFAAKPTYQLIYHRHLFNSVANIVSPNSYVEAISIVLCSLISMLVSINILNSFKEIPPIISDNIWRRKSFASYRKKFSHITDFKLNTTFILLNFIFLSLSIVFIIISFRMYGIFSWRPQDIGVYGGLEIITKAPIALLIIWIYRVQRFNYVFWILFISTLFSYLASGTRSSLISVLITILVSFSFRIYKIKFIQLSIVGFLLTGLTWWSHRLNTFLKYYDSYATRPSKYSGIIDNIFSGSALFPYDFMTTLTMFGSELKIDYPFYCYKQLFTFFIPSQLWADKPIALGTLFASDNSSLVSVRAWSVSFVGDSYLSGGIILVIVNSFLLGMFIHYFYINTLNSDNALTSKFCKLYFLPPILTGFSLVLFKNGITSYITNVIVISILTCSVEYLLLLNFKVSNS